MTNEYKICPECNKEFTKEEYAKSMGKYITSGQVNNYWKNKKYCSYNCSYKHNSKKQARKILTEVKNHPLTLIAPIEIWEIKDGKVTKIKTNIYGEDIIFIK